MRDAIALEEAGIPTISIAHKNFEKAARIQAKLLGYPDLPILVVSDPKEGNLVEEEETTLDKHYQLIVNSLSRPPQIPVQ